jgi:hypothetical protein
MWKDGVPPLGYAVRERKLIVVEREAETVRHIFHRYAALGSVRLLTAELETHGIAGKSWTSASGRSWGGQPLGRGALYTMLRNRIYPGEIVHNDQTYPGEHAAIIDPGVWDTVQARLTDNAVERGAGIRVKNLSLLGGLLFDSEGQRLTPTHAVQSGRHYRYYVSRPLITGARPDGIARLRLPAAEIEQIDALAELNGCASRQRSRLRHLRLLNCKRPQQGRDGERDRDPGLSEAECGSLLLPDERQVGRSISIVAVRPEGCRPSRMAVVMSGAR